MTEKLNRIVAEVLDLEDSEIIDDLSPETAELWDSLNHLRMMTAIEQEFGIKFSMEEIESVKNIARLREIVNNHVQSS